MPRIRMIAAFGLGFLAVGCACSVFAEVGQKTVFHVARTGLASNDGTEAAPFATLERAQQAVREKIAAGLSGNISVIVQAGVYELTTPLLFTPLDSGTAKYSITYAATAGEAAVISGGRKITGWQKTSNNVWTAELAEVREGKWYFRNLFVNDRRATRARNPNATEDRPYFQLAGVDLSTDKRKWAMTLAPGQVADWKNLSDVELVIMQQWTTTHKRLQSVNPASGTLVLEPPHIATDPRIEPRAGFLCYLENARAFLDQPGEWYLDRTTGTLSYWPREGEDLKTAEVIAPRLTALLEIRGTAQKPVQNLHFLGMRFVHTDFPLPPQGFVGAAHGLCRGNAQTGHCRVARAVHWEFARSCSIEDGAIAHVGGNALEIDEGCADARIEGNHIFDVGDIGISLGVGMVRQSPAVWPSLARQPHANRVVNNLIHDCGVVYHEGAAVLLRCASQTVVAHNLIHDSGLHGIAIPIAQEVPPPGIADGYAIEHNHIHHVVKMLGDGGGVYVWGIQTHGVIQGNVIHDVTPSKVGGPEFDGIYFDDDSRGYQVDRNIVYNIAGKALQFVNCRPESHLVHDNFWYNPNRFLNGQRGYAQSFTADNFLDFPHQPSLEPAQLTVEAWVNLTAAPAGSDPSTWIACKNSDELANGNYALAISHNNVGAYLNIGGGRENCYAAWSSTGPVSSNAWHLLAMTYDGQQLSVFCDGHPMATTAIGRPRTAGQGVLRIGKRADGYNPSFPGLISTIRIFNRALPAEEIQAYYSSPSSPLTTVPPGVVFDWNAADLYNKMARILAEAGPEEPYRTRLGIGPAPGGTERKTAGEKAAAPGPVDRSSYRQDSR